MVKELSVKEGDWVANKSLGACCLNQEGIIVLGIYRNNGNYVGAPKDETMIYPEDQLILYGRSNALRELDTRHADATGEEAHGRAVVEQQRHISEQDAQEERDSRKK
jgi:uncharacterized protein with PhoU and TrkA domain